ncbi:4-hydroxythreonine-4-phosphate dehydrogenase PdxA [candidate division KSB1 bacterium]|nr:4-hydroxythreonine-4-phosphate dehydrogenase PdxA [candidate division KSB1 bacterium]
MTQDHMFRVGITMGDYNGVGPEVTLKAVAGLSKTMRRSLVLIGSPLVYESLIRSLSIPFHLKLTTSIDRTHQEDESLLLYNPIEDQEIIIHYGTLSAVSGRAAASALISGIELAKKGQIDAVVTAPVNKHALGLAGYHYPGQTEILAEYTGSSRFIMMLLSQKIKVALITTHCAISEIAGKLSRSIIREKIAIVHQSLLYDFKIDNPTIAVTSLNPHGGEGGLFGYEEETIITPAINDMRREGIDVHGPFSADSLFANVERSSFDAYIAMYHDQGMIPAKMMSFGAGVNFTAGLNIIRTSPDHGTAFDIAGKFVADPGSMKEAIKLAYELLQKRNHSSTL